MIRKEAGPYRDHGDERDDRDEFCKIADHRRDFRFGFAAARFARRMNVGVQIGVSAFAHFGLRLFIVRLQFGFVITHRFFGVVLCRFDFVYRVALF